MTETDERFLREIDRFLAETGMTAAAFGKVVCSDARLRDDIERGRSISLRTYERAVRFMAKTREFRAKNREAAASCAAE